MDMGLDQNAYAELREYFRLYDPMHEHEEETFMKLGYIDGQHLASRIKAEVLMLTGLLDNVCPPSTQYAAYNKMTCKKKHLLYPEYYYETLAKVNDRYPAGMFALMACICGVSLVLVLNGSEIGIDHFLPFVFPIYIWRNTVVFFENLEEMSGGQEAYICYDGLDGVVCFTQ